MAGIDGDVKEYFIKRLFDKGWFNIIDTDDFDIFCFYDISADITINGKTYRYLFELKERSKKFNDNTMEKSKLDNFKNSDEEFDGAYLVSFYNDEIRFSDILNDPYTVSTYQAPRYTRYDDSSFKVEKTFIHYTNWRTFRYE